jgi:peptidoglycan/xylan/chitin deacetylase (PgdA/CDA1 family)
MRNFGRACGLGFAVAAIVLLSIGSAQARDRARDRDTGNMSAVAKHRDGPRWRHGSRSGGAVPPVAVTISDAAFSPNGDGRQDQTTIRGDTTPDATFEVAILDHAGALLRTWAAVGPMEVVWDGRDSAGKVVSDGGYVVRAVATDGSGSATTTAEVTVDTRAPHATILRVSPSKVTRRRLVRFEIRAEDRASPLSVTLLIDDRLDRVAQAEFEMAPGSTLLRWRPRYPSHKMLYPGPYLATLAVHDDAGNVGSSRPRPWRVERPTPPRVIRRLDGAGPRVALTFDDCHFAQAWRRMLRVLRQMNAGGTFFCPGRQILANPTLARRTTVDGHVIGSHGWDHAIMTKLSSDALTRRLRADAAAMWRVARDTTAPYMRPPEGKLDGAVVATSGETGHPRVMLWDVDPQDWRRPPPEVIVSTVVGRSNPGSIVVLHTLPGTAVALPRIIAGLRDRGLEPVGLPELFRAAGQH